ncbi:MAG: hypothetical protein WCF85_15745, partial [Rhodospirillaceae bacterium]
RRLRSLADTWREIAGSPPDRSAALIAADRIDILFDLAGHTAGNALPVFAYKPSPVQATWLGYPDTTGLSRIDYRLMGRPPTPEEQALSSERLLGEGWGIFRPPAGTPDVVPPPVLAGGPPVYGAFNKPLKTSERCFAAWCRILTGVPGSRLLLSVPGCEDSAVREHWQRRFEGAGIDAERVELFGRLPLPAFLEMIARVDVALDPFPYNGGTTTLLTAWMGVPLVCLCGRDGAGQTGAAVMSALGLGECVATDEDTYVRTAIELARSPAMLAEMRATGRARMLVSPLMDEAAYARSFLATLRQIWRDHVGRAAHSSYTSPEGK